MLRSGDWSGLPARPRRKTPRPAPPSPATAGEAAPRNRPGTGGSGAARAPSPEGPSGRLRDLGDEHKAPPSRARTGSPPRGPGAARRTRPHGCRAGHRGPGPGRPARGGAGNGPAHTGVRARHPYLRRIAHAIPAGAGRTQPGPSGLACAIRRGEAGAGDLPPCRRPDSRRPPPRRDRPARPHRSGSHRHTRRHRRPRPDRHGGRVPDRCPRRARPGSRSPRPHRRRPGPAVASHAPAPAGGGLPPHPAAAGPRPGSYDGGYFFEGELFLLDLASGERRNLFADDCRREVRSPEWTDARTLRLLLAGWRPSTHRAGPAGRSSDSP